MLTSSLVRHHQSASEVLSERVVSWRTEKGQLPGRTLSLVLTQPYAPISNLREKQSTQVPSAHSASKSKVLLVYLFITVAFGQKN